MGVAMSDPMDVLDYGAPTYSDGSSKFWGRPNPLNPTLLIDSRPFAKFWVLCTDLLDIPWAAPDIATVKKEYILLQADKKAPSKERKRDRRLEDKGREKTAPVKPNSPMRGGGGFPSVELKRVATSPGSSASSLASHKVHSEEPGLTAVQEEDDDEDSRRSGERPNVIPTSANKQDKPNTDVVVRVAESGDDDSSQGAAVQAEVVEEGDGDDFFQHEGDVEEGVTETAGVSRDMTGPMGRAGPAKTNNRRTDGPTKTSPPLKDISVSKSKQQPVAKKLSFTTPPQHEVRASKAVTARKQFLSESERVTTVRQIRMDGIQRAHSVIFCVTVSWHWAGDEAEDEGATVQDRGSVLQAQRALKGKQLLPDL